MVNFYSGLGRKILSKQATFTVAAMAVAGYIYGKAAGLPAGQIAIIWAVWRAAEDALLHLVSTLTKNHFTQQKWKAVIVIASGLIAIPLTKTGLLGPKMMSCIITLRALYAIGQARNHHFENSTI
jgi:hypothetical protein